MMGHKECFYAEILLIIPKLSLLPLLIWSTVDSNQDPVVHSTVSLAKLLVKDSLSLLVHKFLCADISC